MLISPDGSYLHTTFKGANGTWTLSAVDMNGDTPAMQALDTFVNEKREFQTIKRCDLKKLFDAKKIWL